MGRTVLMHRPKRTSPLHSAANLASANMWKPLYGIAACMLALAPASATEVTSDDTRDLYAISGAIILNASAPDAVAAATCTNCHWRVIRICTGGALEERRPCPGTPCSRSADTAELWRADAPAAPPVGDPAWQYRGLMCLTEPPLSAGSVDSAIHDLQLRALPALRPASQPSGTTLTGLPTYFQSGQPAQFIAVPADVAGVTVQITATPRWTWDFGHGDVMSTADPGLPYPKGRLRHTYPRRGIYRVRATTTWTAHYSARGIPDIPVSGDITQTAWFDLRVREARRFIR